MNTKYEVSFGDRLFKVTESDHKLTVNRLHLYSQYFF